MELGAGNCCMHGMSCPRMKSKNLSPSIVPVIKSAAITPSEVIAITDDIRVPLTDKLVSSLLGNNQTYEFGLYDQNPFHQEKPKILGNTVVLQS